MSIAAIRCPRNSLSSDLCADEIEQRIIRAYIQLMFRADSGDGSRTVTVMRMGWLEVRLTERPAAAPGMAPFRLEIFPVSGGSSIAGCKCFELDETELATAVDLVLWAARESGKFPSLQ